MINEVIETLKAYTDGKDNVGKVEISVMQLNRIIKALEQQSTDAVDRQAVLDINEHHHGQMPNHVNHEIWKEIKALPPVTPQPKMGRWSHDGSHWENRFICSECGYKLFDEQTNYCPNCGAKMSEIPTGAEGSDKE